VFKNTIKVFKIESKRKRLYEDDVDIMFSRYKYIPASLAVKLITDAALEFNNGSAPELFVKVIIKYTEAEKAKIKISGKHDSVERFINMLIAQTDLLEHFDIKF
jgi:hypothetical protein